MLAGSWCPVLASARSTAWWPTRSISRSVAMLSLLAIIFSASSRTGTRDPGANLSKPDDPTALASLVMVSSSSHDRVPARAASATAYST